MKVLTLPINQDWLAEKLPKGIVLRFLNEEYNSRNKTTLYLFEVLGQTDVPDIKIELI